MSSYTEESNSIKNKGKHFAIWETNVENGNVEVDYVRTFLTIVTSTREKNTNRTFKPFPPSAFPRISPTAPKR